MLNQEGITEERIVEVVNSSPRRMKLASEWQGVLKDPDEYGENYHLLLPFPESYLNSFRAMCDLNHYAKTVRGNRCLIYLNDTNWNEDDVETAREWLESVGQYVGIRDCLAISFALDYRMCEGAVTDVGSLCRRAKPYGDERPDEAAIAELGERCVEFLKEMTCYDSATSIVAMPGSRPNKRFDLPRSIAQIISEELGREDLSDCVKTIREREQLKSVSVADKLATIRGTIEVDENCINGKTILLIDDLYQSGTSINYVAMLLLEAGAEAVLGLACEKTMRNDDNV